MVMDEASVRRADAYHSRLFQSPGRGDVEHQDPVPCAVSLNGSQRAATLSRGREPVRGNGTAGRVAYITVNGVLRRTGVSSTTQGHVAHGMTRACEPW